MIIFPIVIVVSAVLWVYYKVAIVRNKGDGLTQSYFNAKSRICLGTFISFFGVNQYLFYLTQLALFIALIFLALGVLQIYVGFKEARHYKKEYRRLYPTE
jgi:Flp pilus assembly protein TadB